MTFINAFTLAAPATSAPTPAYAELHCLSNFSFQRGASHPDELVARAAALGYAALAITDECSVAGVVRAHVAAKKLGLKLLLGAEFVVQGAWAAALGSGSVTLVVLAHNLAGWGNLCEFITAARTAAPKGEYVVDWRESDLASLHECSILLVPPRAITFEALCAISICAAGLFSYENLWLAVELVGRADDALWLHTLQRASRHTGVPLVAAGNVHMHVRSRKPLQDVITAVRVGLPVRDCGTALQPHGQLHLRPRARLAQVYPAELLAATLTVAARCDFSLEELRYQYPLETVPSGLCATQALRQFTYEGASRRYPQGVAARVQELIEHELALIAELKYEMYFLTVHDIVRFARDHHILCQGRGSAANSAVCYCLGITEVDPSRMSVLFERFISRERNEPPDIDVDFEHERREEVIQYIYAKYGRDRAALTATVVSYRPRSAIRDVGKALGVAEALIEAFAKDHHWFDGKDLRGSEQKIIGVRPQLIQLTEPAAPDPTLVQWLDLTRQLLSFPRHLSQHVGGFVLTRDKLTRLVPVENAAMKDRSIIQWDKDDLDAMGLLKVDVLALGMLSAIRRCLSFISAEKGYAFQMQDVPAEDAATYDMICQADTVGVFQIESRAQMSMLPRLKPRCFYDLVIEVAIVRPGPIQGGMVHPYLKSRQNPGAVQYPYPQLRAALERTLGVPIFQEQVMQVAMIAADFSGDEADDLRRSMAAWKRKGGVHRFHDRLVDRMVIKGYPREFAEAIFKQIEGFGEYGFPESHAASFALLVYVSCWLKKHHPDCFLAAMLNSQPLGFYTPSQLVQDAQRHGIEVRAVNVMVSDWDCTLEAGQTTKKRAEKKAIRLGLRQIGGLHRDAAQRILSARQQAAFTSTEDLALRAALDQGDLKALASADALAALSGHRRQQVWDASAQKPAPELFKAVPVEEEVLELPAAPEGEDVVFDYAALGLTLRRHPLAILRPRLAKMALMTAAQMRDLPTGRAVRACGIVTVRQQPGTAKGVTFVTLEDETGTVNVIVWKSLREQQRSALVRSRLMAVHGEWQRDDSSGGLVCHLIARQLQDLTPLLGRLAIGGREFH